MQENDRSDPCSNIEHYLQNGFIDDYIKLSLLATSKENQLVEIMCVRKLTVICKTAFFVIVSGAYSTRCPSFFELYSYFSNT